MSPPYNVYSLNIEESKKNGVFDYEVTADKPDLFLDSSIKIKIIKAWIENAASRQVYVFGKSQLTKLEGVYQLIMVLKIDSIPQKNSGYSYFIGNKHLDTFIHYSCDNYYSHRIDSLKVPIYRELTPELPSRKERKAFDTLLFVKQ